MKIITFQGGLGNQMFQYQFYLWLLTKTDDKIFGYYPKKGLKAHNGLEIERCFKNVSLPTTNSLINLIVKGIKLFNLIGVKYISTMSDLNINRILFEDYWQDLKFRNDFCFDFDSSNIIQNKKNLWVLDQIITGNSVSLHVRRGDYLTEKYTKIYGTCSIEYYNNSIKYILESIDNPKFYIFSDECDWVKENIKIPDATYIDWNTNSDSFIDMYLMSKCKHNIIANSSFSWWSAYNNFKECKIVIAPKDWFVSSLFKEPDIFPNTCLRL